MCIVYNIYIYICHMNSLSEVCGMYHTEPRNIFLLGPVSSVSVVFFYSNSYTDFVLVKCTSSQTSRNTVSQRTAFLKSHQLNTNYTPAYRT